MKIKNTTVIVEPGQYWVGDPCYIVPDAEWMDLLQSCGYFDESPIGLTPSGVQVLAFGTAWGDGVYYDLQGREYGVDAGIIGLVPAGMFPPPADGLMHLVTFDREVECGAEDGIITFGDIDINTAGEDEDEDEDYNIWEDEDEDQGDDA